MKKILIRFFYHHWRFPSIKRGFFLIAIFFALMMLVILYIIKKQEYARRQNDFLISIAHRIEKMVNTELNYAKYQLKYIKNQIIPIDGEIKKVNEVLQNLIIDKEIGETVSWNRISWIDKHDHLRVNSINGILPVGTKSSNINYVVSAKKNIDKFVIDKTILGFTSKSHVVPLAMGINDKHNKYLGTIVIGLDIITIINKINKEIGCNGLEFAIVNSSNDVLLKSNKFDPSELDKIIKYKPKNHYQELLNFNQSIFGDYKAVYFHQAQDYPLKIVTRYSPDYMWLQRLLPQDNSPNIYLSLVLTIFGFVATFMIYLHRTVISPISKLSTVANTISRGKNVNFPRFGTIEIQNLANALIRLQNSFQSEMILRKELNHEKKASKRIAESKNEMTEAICHDLKNHIFAVGGLLEVLRSDFKVSDCSVKEYHRFINLVGMQIARLQDFVEDFTNNKSGFHQYVSIEMIPDLQIVELLDEVLQIASPQAKKEKITIEFKKAEQLPLVLCNPKHLRQISSNLLSNAIKYSNEGSLVQIITTEDNVNQELIISFVDNGIGMSAEEVLLLIKGEGFKVNKSGLRKKFNSQGLGIKNVKRLLDLNGGRLEIESSKNIGSKFSIFLKISRNSNKNNGVKESNRSIKIINVDDNLVNLITTQKKIEKNFQELSCEIATNAKDGLKMIEEDSNKYHLALVDIDMPDSNGYDLTLAIRKTNRNIPILAYSSRNYDEIKHYLHHSMINDYISKENSNEIFLSIVRKWLDKMSNKDSLFLDNNIARNNIHSIIANKRIMVIDDQSTNLLIIKKQLENLGAIVETSQSINKFWQIYNDSRLAFDIIISDIDLIDGSGIDIIKNLRAKNTKIVAIAITGNAKPIEVMQILYAGFDDYFIKGTNIKILMAIIANSLLLKTDQRNTKNNSD
jgi:signal transduction histidine kinase/DNA-binding response OmpR family regulator